MADAREIEFVLEPQDKGGYHVYASDLSGLHTQGDSLDDATENTREALELYVEGLREDGRSLDTGVRPAQAAATRVNGLAVVSGAQLIRALERLGWQSVRQRGSHVPRRHPERRTFLVVPLPLMKGSGVRVPSSACPQGLRLASAVSGAVRGCRERSCPATLHRRCHALDCIIGGGMAAEARPGRHGRQSPRADQGRSGGGSTVRASSEPMSGGASADPSELHAFALGHSAIALPG
jgi:predicted RNase H-like HicB family nuclease/predicted RNA binding protein YcfA (HicA-like mRNA interferase family)